MTVNSTATSPPRSVLFGTSTQVSEATMMERRRSSRMSISSMGSPQSHTTDELERDVTTRLTIMALNPSPKKSPNLLPQSSPRRAHPMIGALGPSPLFDKPGDWQAIRKPPQETMPRTPNKLYSEKDVYKHLAESSADCMSPTGAPNGDDGTNEMVRAIDDDILLPFNDRLTEVRQLLEQPVNKHLYQLLRSDTETWTQINSILDIPREVMPDEEWVAELKKTLRSRSESLWERLRNCLGIDCEDAFESQTAEDAFHAAGMSTSLSMSRSSSFFSPLLDGDQLLEAQRVSAEIAHRQVGGTDGSETAILEGHSPSNSAASSPVSTRRHFRTLSTSSARSEKTHFGMASIAENEGSAFPSAAGPPRKLNSAFLAEQDRQLSSDTLLTAKLSNKIPSVLSEDPPDEEEPVGVPIRRQSLGSIHSDSNERRLRGLRFTMSNCAAQPRSSADLAARPDIIEHSDGSVKERQNHIFAGRQTRGPAILT